MVARRAPDPAVSGQNILDSILAYWWLWAGVVTIVALLNLGALVQNIDPQPLSYIVNPFPVIREQLRAGDILTTMTYRCNNLSRKITYVNHRRWERIDDGGATPPIPIPDVALTAEPGCERTFSRRNTIPDDLTPGVWIIVGEAVVQGRVREWRIPYETEPFEVLPK